MLYKPSFYWNKETFIQTAISIWNEYILLKAWNWYKTPNRSVTLPYPPPQKKKKKLGWDKRVDTKTDNEW